MKKVPILIFEDTLNFKRGQLLEDYRVVEEGVEDLQGNFLHERKYAVLTENLSKEDEKKIKAMIRQTLKGLLWNLYTKSAVVIPN